MKNIKTQKGIKRETNEESKREIKKEVKTEKNPEIKSEKVDGGASGFTLIEILLVMAIIAVLAGVVIVAINPARQFAQARNSQRTSNVFSILNAINQNMTDNQGVLNCAAGLIPTTATVMKSSGGYNIAPCITPTYLSLIPFDPSSTGAHFTDNSDYNTGYTIIQDSTTGRITVAAPEALNASELNKSISATR